MIIDVLVLVALLISAGVAFFRGFIREILTIAGVVGGMAAAYWGGPKLNIHMRGWLGVEDNPEEPQKLFDLIPYELVSTAVSYGLIFIIVVITISIISHFLAEKAQNVGLGAIDRTFGVIFGLIRAVLLLGILYMPLYALVERDIREDWFKGSHSHTYIQATAHWLSGFIPAEGLKVKKEELEEQTSEKAKAHLNTAVQKRLEDGKKKNNEDGYNETFRQEMDHLFEQGQEQ
jgi:membrane protein required for colicin V production